MKQIKFICIDASLFLQKDQNDQCQFGAIKSCNDGMFLVKANINR